MTDRFLWRGKICSHPFFSVLYGSSVDDQFHPVGSIPELSNPPIEAQSGNVRRPWRIIRAAAGRNASTNRIARWPRLP